MEKLPRKGDRITVYRQEGYRMVQERPFQCRIGCVCGECNGHPVEYPGTVIRTSYFADNSIESRVQCDDGEIRNVTHSPPSGDRCF